ncbi:tonB-system energizer ExbB [Rhizobium sp. SYY.PMSO]|uniref:tonB-system energizer ExbB n=1 Tax=Rhizobium sp. SYY.PMSO TaxID=3382192 RepID=UPI00398FEADC
MRISDRTDVTLPLALDDVHNRARKGVAGVILALALLATSAAAQENGQTSLPAPALRASTDYSQAVLPVAQPLAAMPVVTTNTPTAVPVPASEGHGNAEPVASEGAAANDKPVAAEAAPASVSGASDQAVATSAADAAAGRQGQAATAASLPQDLSPWSMFVNASIIVKVVMSGLALASLVTWTIWLAKGLELAGARRRARSASRKLERADTLSAAAREIQGASTRRGPVADLVEAALRETTRSSNLSGEGVKERVAIALSRIEARAGRSMARGTGLLATIGSTAPFVGLFGTVWGIMNSFIGISQSHTTNLAVVAPGIAEALLATAIGLVAAIPAVIIYNVFARAIAGYRALLADASGEVLQHLSRDLERQVREQGIRNDSGAATPAQAGRIASGMAG